MESTNFYNSGCNPVRNRKILIGDYTFKVGTIMFESQFLKKS